MTSIETPRLTLRPIGEDDLTGICRVQSDPRVYALMPLEPFTREESRAWLQRCLARADGTVGFRAALLKETGDYAGHAGLLPQVVDGVEELEIGYWFAPEYWGRGLATEAACALRD